MKKFKLLLLICLRCGHQWHPHKEVVKICPRCKSASWDTRKDGKARASGFMIKGKRTYLRLSPEYSREERDLLVQSLERFLG